MFAMSNLLPDPMTYAGVGTRELPAGADDYLADIASALAARGYQLSTGDAKGADSAFIRGARRSNGRLRIFSAKPSRRHPDAMALSRQPEALRRRAFELASRYHPGWQRMVDAGKYDMLLLHARNGQQVLGPELDLPVRCVLCWADGSTFDREGRVINVSGGTGQAVRLAVGHGIPVYNLALTEHRARVKRMLGE